MIFCNGQILKLHVILKSVRSIFPLFAGASMLVIDIFESIYSIIERNSIWLLYPYVSINDYFLNFYSRHFAIAISGSMG